MYLRFITPNPVDGMHSRQGFFDAAWDMVEDASADQFTVSQVKRVLQWYADNLNIPDRFSRTKSAGWYRRDTRGLSWFKPTATDHIRHGFELKSLLDQNGYPIEIIKADRIGYVIYQDEYQVVAEPFADTVS
ncbi:MAG: hypothetical protein AAGO57_00235 [Pseudomonadota bacterium]